MQAGFRGGGRSVVSMALASALLVGMAVINQGSAATGSRYMRAGGTTQVYFFAHLEFIAWGRALPFLP